MSPRRDTPVPRTPAARAVVAGVAAWGVALAILPLGIVVPRVPGVGVVVGVLVAGFTAHAVVASLSGFLAAYLARRQGAHRLAGAVAVIAAVATVASCVPLVTMWRAATERGLTPSLAAHLRGGFNGGRPDPARTMVYDQVAGVDLVLDAWLPDGAVATPRPAVVWVHGGGWVGGRRSNTRRWNTWFNERGYAMFDIEYRLAPPPRWSEAPDDVRCAVRWVQANAERLGVDPERIVLAGESAGAHLALLAAYRADTAPGRTCSAGPQVDGSVRAAVAVSPATDLATLWDDGDVSEQVQRWIEAFAGGTPAEVPDRYIAASPLVAATAAAGGAGGAGATGAPLPATLLVHGARDHAVPLRQSERLAGILADAGVAHELVELPYTDHGFTLFWASLPTQTARHVIERFLGAHL